MRKVLQSAVAGAVSGVIVCFLLMAFAVVRAMETEANISLPPLITAKYLEQDTGFGITTDVTWITVIGVVTGFAALFAGSHILLGRRRTQW